MELGQDGSHFDFLLPNRESLRRPGEYLSPAFAVMFGRHLRREFLQPNNSASVHPTSVTKWRELHSKTWGVGEVETSK